ncbi:hypothetical protein [Aeromonas salmonicida]|uniref:hypothetical protein n=1 Tax=Aeromonas salmonicida TaxID=645 RepID=UPI000F7B5058|nr:hypothetical protein [Aeromonas salmonicida]RSM22589.1 hypothetical protein C5B77_22275 [Aeromonas salmonicida]
MEPAAHLAVIVNKYPTVWNHVNQVLSARGHELPDWPEWCFIPQAGWKAIHVMATHNKLSSEEGIVLAALGAWRYSQGAYRYDPTVYNALLHSPPRGTSHSDLLYRLPQWCVYVETPGMMDGTCHGFWAHLEMNDIIKRAELRLLLNLSHSLTPLYLPIGPWSFNQALMRLRREFNLGELDIELAEKAIEAITPCLSLLLYLCQNSADIYDVHRPSSYPVNPTVQHDEGTTLLYPADIPRVWMVGNDVGRMVRFMMENATDDASPSSPFWLDYWEGPKGAPGSTHVLKWCPPIFDPT